MTIPSMTRVRETIASSLRLSLGAMLLLLGSACGPSQEERADAPERPGGEQRPAVAQSPEQQAAAARETEARLARDLEDPDPAIRVEAVMGLPVEGVWIGRLIEILANDPAPEVRAEAADELAASESAESIEGLLQAALNDPDSTVVIAALESLMFAADELVIPRLRPLLEHSDPAVREIAAETIEFLE